MVKTTAITFFTRLELAISHIQYTFSSHHLPLYRANNLMKRIIATIPGLFGILWFFIAGTALKHPHCLDNDSSKVKLHYLGTAGWEITDDKTVILVDPYLSRLRIDFSGRIDSGKSQTTEDSRKVYNLDDFAIADTSIINKHITRANYILVQHSHADHVMDVPFIARKTGRRLLGLKAQHAL